MLNLTEFLTFFKLAECCCSNPKVPDGGCYFCYTLKHNRESLIILMEEKLISDDFIPELTEKGRDALKVMSKLV